MVKNTRKKLSASLEDYLEAILNLSNTEGHAHCTDIARILNVAKPSVTGALRTLKKKGLANYEPYGSVTLTNKGKRAAEKVANKHRIIKSFFENVLGIDPDTAGSAACKVEHTLGTEIIEHLMTLNKFAEQNESEIRSALKNLDKNLNKRKRSKK